MPLIKASLMILSILVSAQAWAFSSSTPGLVSAVSSSCEATTNLGLPECFRLTKSFVRNIDFEGFSKVPRSAVIYKKKFLKIIHDNRFIPYLNALNVELSIPRDEGPQPFSLYDFTSRYLNSPSEAIEWVGIIFQDNTYDFHFRWLEQNPVLPQETLDLWKQVSKHVAIHELEHPTGRTVRLFPSPLNSVAEHLSDKPYYFYLIYLAKAAMMRDLPRSEAQIDQYLMFIVLRYSFRRLDESSHGLIGKADSVYDLIWGSLPVSAVNEDGKLVPTAVVQKAGKGQQQWFNQFVDVYTTIIALNYQRFVGGDCPGLTYKSVQDEMLLSPADVFSKTDPYLAGLCR